MKKIIYILILIAFVPVVFAQDAYRTRALIPSIKTLQIHLPDEPFSLPAIELGSGDELHVQFDEMSHDIKSYSYRVLHCNDNWTRSALTPVEYLQSFDNGMITNYANSLNTSYLYTHYSFYLPNDDVAFTKSGNYVVEIYEDSNPDKTVAQACFYVVEPKVKVNGTVRGNTDTELNKRMQQLDFEIALDGYAVQDANAEIKVVIRQNNRLDNEVSNIKPTYLRGDKLLYQNNRALIFEGGNEYKRFDIASRYVMSERVDRIDFDHNYYHVYLYPDKIQPYSVYQTEPDANGGYIINLQNSYFDKDTEADYFYVYFAIPRNEPFFDGQIYIGGEYNYNLLDENSRMQYDFNSGMYFKKLLLKQGGYNYQYWFLPKGQQKANVERIEGSFWQTQNQYTVYVYHRPWGGRYDMLIGVKVIE